MVHNLDREDFILSHFDLLERATLGGWPVTPRSSFEVPSLRWMRKVKCFSTYFIEVLEEARKSRGGLTGRPRPRELPSTEHSTLGGSFISKKKAPTREISRGKSRSWR